MHVASVISGISTKKSKGSRTYLEAIQHARWPAVEPKDGPPGHQG
jgi:hypothetical protein